PNVVTPVIFPPGWLRLATRPVWTGSVPIKNTIGIVLVAAWAARGETVAPLATITATCLPTSSAANAGSRSYCASALRYSIVTFCPSTKPDSFSPAWNSAERLVVEAADPLSRTPITGITASEHQQRAAKPPPLHRQAL